MQHQMQLHSHCAARVDGRVQVGEVVGLTTQGPILHIPGQPPRPVHWSKLVTCQTPTGRTRLSPNDIAKSEANATAKRRGNPGPLRMSWRESRPGQRWAAVDDGSGIVLFVERQGGQYVAGADHEVFKPTHPTLHAAQLAAESKLRRALGRIGRSGNPITLDSSPASYDLEVRGHTGRYTVHIPQHIAGRLSESGIIARAKRAIQEQEGVANPLSLVQDYWGIDKRLVLEFREARASNPGTSPLAQSLITPDRTAAAARLTQHAKSIGLQGRIVPAVVTGRVSFFYHIGPEGKPFSVTSLGSTFLEARNRLEQFGPQLDSSIPHSRAENPIGRLASSENPDDAGRRVSYRTLSPPKSQILEQLYRSRKRNATARVTWKNRGTVEKGKHKPRGFYHGNKWIGSNYRDAARALGLTPGMVDRAIRNEMQKDRKLQRDDMLQLQQVVGFEPNVEPTETEQARLRTNALAGSTPSGPGALQGRAPVRGLLSSGPQR